MAMDVLSDVRAAEDQAQEIRRLAAIAAKDALKQAEQENAEISEKELSSAKRSSSEMVDAARQAAQDEFDALQAIKLKDCIAIKTAAERKLSQAADVCLERIIK